ncbi:hypothetical protein RO3G_04402 [Rhizopus delemar RA 99-880]|uniref:Coth-domain-containing protein n=3 Tax=Rhizopus TaxID=4842 RepID=I1BU17_RHIO9|nr:hypothetical protein RO3G_04402 [Rhizopus delemar RA 99-880]|eukprot:EIE79697.1 hypothetical protein RO3G_04402 [Rhizopus delemar RA 99-880]
MGVAVVVDGTTFPLQQTLGILYQGEAPIAKTSYHYAIVDANHGINASESFARNPIQADSLNEFFNRSMNAYNVSSLPQVLPPLPSIKRIASDLHKDGQIPTIHIWGNETAITYLNTNQQEDIDVELNFTYFGEKETQNFENAKVSVAGRSSRFIEKLSYNLKIKKKSDDSLFNYRTIKLRAMAFDPTYVREKLCFSAIKSVGIPATEFSYVRLFMNNKPLGLYGLIETFQDPWLANEFANGDKSYESGYLYQGVLVGNNQSEWRFISDLSYRENITTYALGEYKIKAGPSKDEVQAYAALQDFTKFVYEASNTTTINDWEKHIDTEGFLRAMALENLLGFSDGYMTMADNYYMYSNPADNGRMIYIPSDLDTTIGIALFDMKLMLTGNYTEFPGLTFRPLTKKFFSYEYFSTPYQALLLNLTKTLVNPTIMNSYIDSLTSMIRADIEWDQSLPKVGHNLPPPSETNMGGDVRELFPPGYITSWTDIVPVNVQDFIAKKSAAILAFYNQSM